jgi:hypothetical protein
MAVSSVVGATSAVVIEPVLPALSSQAVSGFARETTVLRGVGASPTECSGGHIMWPLDQKQPGPAPFASTMQ